METQQFVGEKYLNLICSGFKRAYFGGNKTFNVKVLHNSYSLWNFNYVCKYFHCLMFGKLLLLGNKWVEPSWVGFGTDNHQHYEERGKKLKLINKIPSIEFHKSPEGSTKSQKSSELLSKDKTKSNNAKIHIQIIFFKTSLFLLDHLHKT